MKAAIAAFAVIGIGVGAVSALWPAAPPSKPAPPPRTAQWPPEPPAMTPKAVRVIPIAPSPLAAVPPPPLPPDLPPALPPTGRELVADPVSPVPPPAAKRERNRGARSEVRDGGGGDDICARHGRRKVYTNKYSWRCRR